MATLIHDGVALDEEAVRRTAFFLWEQDGRPEGRELEYWTRAEEQLRRQLVNDQALAEGDPAEAEPPFNSMP
jgi:hypothetical protein